MESPRPSDSPEQGSRRPGHRGAGTAPTTHGGTTPPGPRADRGDQDHAARHHLARHCGDLHRTTAGAPGCRTCRPRTSPRWRRRSWWGSTAQARWFTIADDGKSWPTLSAVSTRAWSLAALPALATAARSAPLPAARSASAARCPLPAPAARERAGWMGGVPTADLSGWLLAHPRRVSRLEPLTPALSPQAGRGGRAWSYSLSSSVERETPPATRSPPRGRGLG